MADLTISTFKGLSIKRRNAPNGIVLPAKEAIDIDLRGESIRPFKSNKFVQNASGKHIAFFSGSWYSGKENYVIDEDNGFDILIFKDKAEWKKIIKLPSGSPTKNFDTILPISIPKPDTPVVRADTTTLGLPNRAPSQLPYEMGYIISWTRSQDGYIEESGVSAPIESTFAKYDFISFNIKRPLAYPSGVTKWSIYRISNGYLPSTEYNLVAELPISMLEYNDIEAQNAVSLHPAAEGFFVSDNGVRVLSGPADVVFDGMSSELYYGMHIGWKDERIYLSEPNRHYSFPTQFSYRIGRKVIAVKPYGPDLYVFTTDGVQRCIGSNPSNLTILPALFGAGAVCSYSVTSTEIGLFYLSQNGIGRITAEGHSIISRNLLGEEYFRDIKNASMNYAEGILYLFHDKGALIYIQEEGVGFVNLSAVYSHSFFDRGKGVMYVARDGRIEALFQGSSRLSLKYKLADLTLNEPREKYFEHLHFYGSGKFTIRLFLDEHTMDNVRTIDLDSGTYGGRINFPHGITVRSASWSMEGNGEIREIKALLVR